MKTKYDALIEAYPFLGEIFDNACDGFELKSTTFGEILPYLKVYLRSYIESKINLTTVEIHDVKSHCVMFLYYIEDLGRLNPMILDSTIVDITFINPKQLQITMNLKEVDMK